jgi:hypothetical protein
MRSGDSCVYVCHFVLSTRSAMRKSPCAWLLTTVLHLWGDKGTCLQATQLQYCKGLCASATPAQLSCSTQSSGSQSSDSGLFVLSVVALV